MYGSLGGLLVIEQRWGAHQPIDPDVVLTLAGHRVVTAPMPVDDTKSRIVELVRRVNLSRSQAEGLEAMLTAWLEVQRSGQPNGTPNGT
jgi:hypothetical protein